MKHQRHPSGYCFGPRSRKVGNGSIRKPRKSSRFVSKPMLKIDEEVKKGLVNIQYVLGNRGNRKDIGVTNKAYGHNSKICSSIVVVNKNYREKVQRRNHVLQQSKQYLLDAGKVGQRNAIAMKEDLGRQNDARMKQGFVHHANDAKMSSLQPKNLKAMRGLVRLNIDQGPPTWVHKRDKMNGCNDITNDANLRSGNKLLSNEKPKSRLSDEKPKSRDGNHSEGENPTHRVLKKPRKYIETSEDDNNDQSPEGVVYDSTRLITKDDILKDCHAKGFMPFVTKTLNKQCYCCSEPIDEPIWSGLLKIGVKEFIPISGHLSTKSCEKVRNLSKSLSRVVEVTKLPRSKVWPKRWEGSRPINDNIGLYFFPHKMRPDKYHDQLLKEAMENDLALRAIIGDAEMLMFPSSLLPKRYQTFQMKHYLWGVFKPREVDGKQGAALHQPDRATAFAAKAMATRVDTDAASIPPGATGVATDAGSIPAEDATNTPTVPANHGQTDSSSMGAPSGRMFAFVVRQQNPRLEQLIREMQQEGTLVMQGEMMSTGSWPSNMATTTHPGQPSKT